MIFRVGGARPRKVINDDDDDNDRRVDDAMTVYAVRQYTLTGFRFADRKIAARVLATMRRQAD